MRYGQQIQINKYAKTSSVENMLIVDVNVNYCKYEISAWN